MRVVYDTSVLATIVSRRDLILRLQADVSTGRLTLISSAFILDELERVLVAKFDLTKQAAKSRVRLLARMAEMAQPKDTPRVSRDANDDPVIATALAGGAEYIVTFDRDLLVIKQHANVLIVTPNGFKEILSRVE